MIVYIKAFANFREILGRDIQVELDEGSKVRELLDSLCLFLKNTPQLAAGIDRKPS